LTGDLAGTTLTLATTTGAEVRITGEVADNRLTGTLTLSDPAHEAPIELHRFSLPQGYRPVGPVRIYDSRDDGWKFDGGETRWVQAGGQAGLPRDGSIAAVLVNLTMTDTEGPGFLTAWSSDVDEQPG